MNLRNLFVLILMPIVLIACGGNTENTENITQVKQYHETDTFMVSDIPNKWEVIKTGDLTSNVPETTVVAFRNNIKNEVFTANANIVETTIKDQISSKDLGLSNKAIAKSSLLEFQEIGTEEVVIKVGKEGSVNAVINSFSGKKNATDPIVIFRQLNVVNGQKGYILTAAHLENEDAEITGYLDDILRSLELK